LAAVEAEIDWDILSAQLSVANQDKQRPTIALDENGPQYFWITKNIDFTQLKSDEKTQTLWLSGPDDYGMKEVSWHTIDDAKENATQPYSSVLYFFCSTATTAAGSIATVFTHTLLHQIVNSSPENAKLIAATFVKCLLGEHDRRRRMSRFKEGDSPSTLVKNILEVPDEELVGALVQTIKATEIQELQIIIDGIDITTKKAVLFVQIIYSFVKHMPNAIPKFKALLTSSQNSKLHNVLGSLPCIEYDKERKGLHNYRSLFQILANKLI